MTVVLDHDANRVVWCAKGHGKAVLKPFFEQLSEDQRASIRVVTADGARWIAELAESYCPNAERVMDPFRRELDDRRRRRSCASRPGGGRAAERRGELAAGGAKAVKGSRYAAPNPEDLTEAQASRSRGWPGRTSPCTGPTCSRSACATCSRPAAARRRGSGWSRGSPAPAAPGSTRSRSSPRRCGATRTPSSGPWSSASPTPGSRPSTTRSSSR